MLNSYKLSHGLIDIDIKGTLIYHCNNSSNATTWANLMLAQPGNTKTARLDRVNNSTESPDNWIQFECYYTLDEIFPLIRRDNKLHMEENFESSVDHINKLIETSVVFLEGEIVDESITAKQFISTKKIQNDTVQATLYQNCSTNEIDTKPSTVLYDGNIQYHGVIASKVWVNPNNSIKNVIDYIRQDIIRSLSARIQIHCDALNESEHIDGRIYII